MNYFLLSIIYLAPITTAADDKFYHILIFEKKEVGLWYNALFVVFWKSFQTVWTKISVDRTSAKAPRL